MKEYHGKQHKDGHALWDAWYKAEDDGTEESMWGDWCHYPVRGQDGQIRKYLQIVIPHHGPVIWQYSGEGKVVWDYKGPDNAPTLHPSLLIHKSTAGPGWHGWFKNGVLQEI